MSPLNLLPEALQTCSRCAHRAIIANLRQRNLPPWPMPQARSGLPPQSGYSTKRWSTPKVSTQDEVATKLTLSDALRQTKHEDNSLLSPVHVPEDPSGVLNERHPAASILTESGIVVQRELELMNVMLGFEQANKYVILDPHGHHLGFIAEQDNSIGRTMARQMFSTHRSFTAHIFDKHENEVLRFHRPFSWISSRIGVYDPVEFGKGSYSASRDMVNSTAKSPSAQISALSLSQMPIIGEVQQQWAPLRRKYNLFLHNQPPDAETATDARQSPPNDLHQSLSQQLQVAQGTPDSSADQYNQFAYIDEPFLSWDFSIRSANSQLIGSVNRNWGGIGREFFTDTGVYALRMDAAGIAKPSTLPGPSDGRTDVITHKEEGLGMTLDQRAVMLATAVSIDFDYFSRHSGAGGGMGWMPLWFPMGGGEAAAAGEAAGGAGAVGEAAEGSVIRGADLGGSRDAGFGATAGMGTLAGYEAMRNDSGRDDTSPTATQDRKMEDEQSAQGRWPDPTVDTDSSGAVPRNRGAGNGGDDVGIGKHVEEDTDLSDDGDFFDGF
ncbi:MAG: hypothetical protein Q9177_005098 [Variospora cf. flavescens]